MKSESQALKPQSSFTGFGGEAPTHAPIIEKTPKQEPSKPSKLGSVGFVGATSEVFPIICDQKYVWPQASLDAERRFGQPHARLFPLLKRKVRTPKGNGRLEQASADLVTVFLDAEPGKCSWFRPGQITPISEEAGNGE